MSEEYRNKVVNGDLPDSLKKSLIEYDLKREEK